MKLGNPNGAAALGRAGKGSVALRATVAANADQDATDLSEVIAEIRAAGVVSFREMAEALSLTCRRIKSHLCPIFAKFVTTIWVSGVSGQPGSRFRYSRTWPQSRWTWMGTDEYRFKK